MKKNDVYRWWYKDASNRFEPYWCKSCIGIVKDNGDELYLVDTYGLSNNTVFGMGYIEENLDLVFLGNLDDFELIKEWDVVYYDDSDIMDLTHSNSYGPLIYVRKGAVRSIEKMRSVLLAQLEKCRYKADYYTREVEDYERRLNELTVDSHIPTYHLR